MAVEVSRYTLRGIGVLLPRLKQALARPVLLSDHKVFAKDTSTERVDLSRLRKLFEQNQHMLRKRFGVLDLAWDLQALELSEMEKLPVVTIAGAEERTVEEHRVTFYNASEQALKAVVGESRQKSVFQFSSGQVEAFFTRMEAVQSLLALEPKTCDLSHMAWSNQIKCFLIYALEVITESGDALNLGHDQFVAALGMLAFYRRLIKGPRCDWHERLAAGVEVDASDLALIITKLYVALIAEDDGTLQFKPLLHLVPESEALFSLESLIETVKHMLVQYEKIKMLQIQHPDSPIMVKDLDSVIEKTKMQLEALKEKEPGTYTVKDLKDYSQFVVYELLTMLDDIGSRYSDFITQLKIVRENVGSIKQQQIDRYLFSLNHYLETVNEQVQTIERDIEKGVANRLVDILSHVSNLTVNNAVGYYFYRWANASPKHILRQNNQPRSGTRNTK